MAEKQYLDLTGLQDVAGHVNTRLKTVTTIPVSADNGAVRLYVGATTNTYKNGHIYQYDLTNTTWKDITNFSIIFTGTQAEWNNLSLVEKQAYDICNITDDTESGAISGTTVVANPSGTATDDLIKVQIGSIIYNIPSGTTIVQLPSVIGDSFTYNGTAQGPTITGLDTTHCTVTGATQTNAGTYTLTIALNNPSTMVWSDITTADKTYTYTIAKADQTLTLSKNSVTLNSGTPSDTVTVSGASTSISATSSDTTVATASVSGSTVTISNVNMKTGSATISISAAADANHNASATVSVAVIVVPDGSTVTPTDDIQTWLHCANILDKSYTTLNNVLADSTTLLALISNNNAADYMVRSTTWATNVCANSTAMTDIGSNNYCANTLLTDSTWRTAICNSTYFESVLNVKVPTMTSNTTPSGYVASSNNYLSGFDPYKAFNGVVGSATDSNRWASKANESDAYLVIKFNSQIILKLINILPALSANGETPQTYTFVLEGSNDNSNYDILLTKQIQNTQGAQYNKIIIENPDNTPYLYYRYRITNGYVVLGGGGNYHQQCRILQLYGRAS